jgi:cyclopropane-fatty-acyl-phospholipid synthase
MTLTGLAESGALPDCVIRAGIRRMLARRLRDESQGGVEQQRERHRQFIEQLKHSPVAIETDAANLQHYEVPTEFFRQVLGPRMKYSCCYYPTFGTALAAAEEAMLAVFCQRADIEDGMQILELGCGWGSLCLWIAQRYPNCSVLAVSNSHTQRQFILSRCAEWGLSNVDVVTADVADFTIDRKFDRVVSVEMFEHVRNYELLLQRIAGWLASDGRLMVHVFCHRQFAYPFETQGESNWMGRHFFTGGIMPSDDLLHHFQRDLLLEDHWSISGTHYARTLEDWLVRCDEHRDPLTGLFQADLGPSEGKRQLQRWRIFFMACAELFAYGGGNEWFVSHYLFRKRGC